MENDAEFEETEGRKLDREGFLDEAFFVQLAVAFVRRVSESPFSRMLVDKTNSKQWNRKAFTCLIEVRLLVYELPHLAQNREQTKVLKFLPDWVS